MKKFLVLLLTALMFLVQLAVAQGTVLLNEDFSVSSGPFCPGLSDCSYAAIDTRHNQWFVSNKRTNFLSIPGCVQYVGSAARIWDAGTRNGYLSFYREIPSRPSEWTVTVKIWIDVYEFGARPGPQISIRENPGCTATPSAGLHATAGQNPAIHVGGALWSAPSYTLTKKEWHTIELKSSPSGSELRAWKSIGGCRPAAAQATAPSLGNLEVVEFKGPNHQPFDYLVDSVLAEDNSVRPGPVLSVQNLAGGLSATLRVDNGTPFGRIGFAYSLVGSGPSNLTAGPCGLTTVNLGKPVRRIGIEQASARGSATAVVPIPSSMVGSTIWFQAIDLGNCQLSNFAQEVVM